MANRRLCLGPAGIINCTPLSALSFWVSLFPRKHGYNTIRKRQIISKYINLRNSVPYGDEYSGRK